MTSTVNKEETFYVGIDVGSTTTKVVVLDKNREKTLLSDYARHHADQLQSLLRVISLLEESFKGAVLHIAFTGSGAKTLSEKLNLPYVQEVVANSIALRDAYENVGTAIELGGQDAKIIFFHRDPDTGKLDVADMRMNGSCAGGTGAFIDETASILKTPVEEFDTLAAQGSCVYEISGRCGVYAKTDIQPLLNQGVAKADIALSSFHAIAKQTIGGLAQGLEIRPPVAFEGGPLTFNRTLIGVFAERLSLSDDEVLLPEHPEIMIARGAAIAAGTMFTPEESLTSCEDLSERVDKLLRDREEEKKEGGHPLFETSEELETFKREHACLKIERREYAPGDEIKCYLGIDSGSTTTKFVLIDEDENIMDSFYSPNRGEPLAVARDALMAMRESYEKMGVKLNILAAGSTGYGEMLFSKGFSTETHVVETVAHARAAEKYIPNATFILDIGGQDMKAIWIDDGVITNIVVNEACSSGCGSFLENFASSLHIPVEKIAESAFSSKHPAELGSRCTVFMNSSIVTEQRNGRQPEDIMAGLCRSIIANVFSKVIRISNLDSLGDTIVVQGGTFENDAVLCAFEQYVGKKVYRSPYPGIMGAIGAALVAKEEDLLRKEAGTEAENHFIGLDNLENFEYRQEANVICPFCQNHCRRSVVTFSNGNSWITNNRCERGEILGSPREENVREKLREAARSKNDIPNLFKLREELLFKDYEALTPSVKRECVIGLPRVLSFWDNMPFWTTFFKSLGFTVKISDPSSHKIYEQGLSAVTSDTVCFPAKLVHGHIRNLAGKGVDRIFMPSIAGVGSENTEKTSESMCAVVKGYPLVIKNSDNPDTQWGIPFDNPLFYWYTKEDMQSQLAVYMKETFDIDREETIEAAEAALGALDSFRSQLKEAGGKVIDDVREKGTYAVILASRPYQNDPLVNHSLDEIFTEFGIPVLTVDSIPGTDKVDLSKSRIDVVNNFHARMLSTAILAAQSDNLEYVQIVSFGCGHDAYLSDEIQRLMKEISGKTPLILKLDESEIQGPLRIRVRSFIETVNIRRRRGCETKVRPLTDPYKVKFTREDKDKKIVLVPNTSHAFCRVMSAAMAGQGIKTVPLEYGREEAIRLGKQYVHNDICFPTQVVIGEILAALKSGKYDNNEVAVAMAKYIGDCRLTHYSALLRKALDDAGYADVPVLTNDDTDYHDLHPGFRMNLNSSVKVASALPMIDALEELLRKIRPYELEKGSSNMAFERAMDALINGMEQGGLPGEIKGFKAAIDIMNGVEYDRSSPRPTVLIVGEYLLNFHPGANHDIEDYLERNGFEIIEAKMSDVIQKLYFAQDEQISTYHLKRGIKKKLWYDTVNHIFDIAHNVTDKIAMKHPLYTPACRLPDLVKESDAIIPHTFDAGEGVLIPAEILHNVKNGCRAVVILQPFGCLPNHVVGRGIVKKLKELCPGVQILPLDYDPDVSFANVENRLQMLINNVRDGLCEDEPTRQNL